MTEPTDETLLTLMALRAVIGCLKPKVRVCVLQNLADDTTDPAAIPMDMGRWQASVRVLYERLLPTWLRPFDAP